MCRNPLFIKSEFSPDAPTHYFMGQIEQVAILYSSSQNSLAELADEFGVRVANVEVAILYSSSQNSLGARKGPPRRKRRVAILYSSSQNSLGVEGSTRSGHICRRNPLFIKSEFSPWTNPGGIREKLKACRNPLFIKSEFSLIYEKL